MGILTVYHKVHYTLYISSFTDKELAMKLFSPICIIMFFIIIGCQSAALNTTPPYVYQGNVLRPEIKPGSLHIVRQEFVYQNKNIALFLVYWSDGAIQLKVYHPDDKKFENIDIRLKAP